MGRPGRIGWVAAQAAGIVLALLALAFRPPATGLLLMVPLTTEAERTAMAGALAGGAFIVARGPLEGSLVVAGSRARLARRGVLLLAAPPSLCGGAVPA